MSTQPIRVLVAYFDVDIVGKLHLLEKFLLFVRKSTVLFS